MANSEARNIGYELHPMFKIYEHHMFSVDRCQYCGSENLYVTEPGPDGLLMCNECDRETVEDNCSFVEWCENYGYNPDRLDAIEVFNDTDRYYLLELIKDVHSESGKIVIVGVDSKENI